MKNIYDSKIIRVGNSAAVTVNKEFDDLGLSVGDFVDVKSLKGKRRCALELLRNSEEPDC